MCSRLYFPEVFNSLQCYEHFILNKNQEYRWTSRNMDPRRLHLYWQMVTVILPGLWKQEHEKWGRQTHQKHEQDQVYITVLWDPTMINRNRMKIVILVFQYHPDGAVFKLSDWHGSSCRGRCSSAGKCFLIHRNYMKEHAEMRNTKLKTSKKVPQRHIWDFLCHFKV